MPDLIAKINKGDYNLLLNEPVFLECALFLAQTLQANEEERDEEKNDKCCQMTNTEV